SVDVCRVPEGDTKIEGLPEDWFGRLIIECPLVVPAGRVAEAHAPERDATDLETRSSQVDSFHRRTPLHQCQRVTSVVIETLDVHSAMSSSCDGHGVSAAGWASYSASVTRSPHSDSGP